MFYIQIHAFLSETGVLGLVSVRPLGQVNTFCPNMSQPWWTGQTSTPSPTTTTTTAATTTTTTPSHRHRLLLIAS
jgi:hypothetical protein